VLDLFALGGFLEFLVQLRPFRLIQLQFRQATLIVNGYGRPIPHRAFDVVDADIVAEHGAGVLIGQLNGRAGETDKRSIRQRLAHVPGEAVDEVVLAAVRLVGNHDDVVAVRKQRVLIFAVRGKKLVDRRENDSAGGGP